MSSSSYQKVRISRKGDDYKPLVRRYPMKRQRGQRPTYGVPVRRYGEVKGMDTDISLNPMISTTNSNASSFVLNLVQSGAASWNRVGRKTHIKSLRLIGNINFNSQPRFLTA